jgi:tetratricopeptide (TPR) repeat protein
MGVVYQARDRKLGRLVALKFLPQQWSHDESAKQRFVREAQAASATQHPNICTIHDIETADDGQLFIVMAFYEGPTLKQRLERGPLALEEALEVATQIADGLAKAHKEGVVHRDIKPGNVMLTEDGVRILDFGLATFVDALKLTAENTPFGTPAYMSPEQVRGQAADGRSDVWAVGVVLYEMLTGHPPFRGSHPEAIGHAIRHETPAPLRAIRPEIPEQIEQLVFRALHKDPSIRYQDGRVLARALRQIRGLSVPLELRTQPVPSPRAGPLTPTGTKPKTRRIMTTAAIAVFVLSTTLVGVLWWLPQASRTLVVVAPLANQTGYENLDLYGPGLTQALREALADSRTIRVLDHARQGTVTRRFRTGAREIPSNELLQALGAETGAPILIVPALVRDGVGWKARLEFREAETARTLGVHETEPFVSAIVEETVYMTLVPALASAIEAHFDARSAWTRLASRLRRAVGAEQRRALPASALAAAVSYEQALDYYEELEYESALRAFAAAGRSDPLNPRWAAWQSRIARLMRRTVDAERFGREASQLLSAETPARVRLFVEAVAAESRRDVRTAALRYRSLAERNPDSPAALMELAEFHDRQGLNDEAIEAYRAVLRLDERFPTPHLRLCQIYNRVPDRGRAREHSQAALRGYRALHMRGGEAQTLLCMTETARSGTKEERAQARGYAEAAVSAFTELNYPYGLSRAHNYVALAAESEGRLTDAAAAWELSLATARGAGNIALEPRILGNLGVTYKALGKFGLAVDYLRQSSKRNISFGDEQEAARNLANLAGIMIAFRDPEKAVTDLKTALAVSERTHDTNFVVLGHQFMAEYHRYAGRHKAAEEELARARTVAELNNLDDEMAAIAADLATSKVELGDYVSARDVILPVLESSTGQDAIHARIRLARARTYMGDVTTAEAELLEVARDLQNRSGTELHPLLQESLGELAYERSLWQKAREHFSRAAALAVDDWPDAASLEAQAYLAILDARDGKPGAAERRAAETLEQASRISRFTLQTKCRLILARIYVEGKKSDAAIRALQEVASPGDRQLGPELRAQMHYWRSRAFRLQRDNERSRIELAAAQSLVQELRRSIPESLRAGFDARPDIRSVLNEAVR